MLLFFFLLFLLFFYKLEVRKILVSLTYILCMHVEDTQGKAFQRL